jgi:hypothetical protein
MSKYTRLEQDKIYKLVRKYSKKRVLKPLTINEIAEEVNKQITEPLTIQYVKWVLSNKA